MQFVSVVMGSLSDWDTMRCAAEVLKEFDVRFETRVMSAHRTPDLVAEYAKNAQNNGIDVIIAGAGMAAALPGVIAAHTTIPVLGVPMLGSAFNGLDSTLSMLQMPGGIPVATFAVGKAGAINAALFAVSILGNKYTELSVQLKKYRTKQAEKILSLTEASFD